MKIFLLGSVALIGAVSVKAQPGGVAIQQVPATSRSSSREAAPVAPRSPAEAAPMPSEQDIEACRRASLDRRQAPPQGVDCAEVARRLAEAETRRLNSGENLLLGLFGGDPSVVANATSERPAGPADANAIARDLANGSVSSGDAAAIAARQRGGPPGGSPPPSSGGPH